MLIGMKSLLTLALTTATSLATLAPTYGGDSPTTHRSMTKCTHAHTYIVYVVPASYRRGFTGGWYALNYPYYWGHAPLVSYYDPYDYNGNYFPLPRPVEHEAKQIEPLYVK